MGLAWGNALFIHIYNDTLTTCLIQQQLLSRACVLVKIEHQKKLKKKTTQSVIYNNALIFH